MYIVSDAVVLPRKTDKTTVEALALPQGVKDAINAAGPRPNETFNVGPGEIFLESVLWYERIQFANKATLTLNPKLSFVALVADELLFTGPPYFSVEVRFQESKAPEGTLGSTGSQGAPGGNGHGGHHHGYPGGRGGAGGRGGDGGTLAVPTIYVLTNSVKAQDAPDQAALFHFSIEGIDGGHGGNGGQGGKGGPGGRGAQAISGPFSCQRGGGKGGPGGPGGYGGQPGDGGAASNGGELVLIGTTSAVDVLKFSEVSNLPGSPGDGGFSGLPGIGGDGGQGGKGKGHCRGGERGSRGGSPLQSPNRGANGAPGAKGLTFIYEVADYHDELA